MTSPYKRRRPSIIRNFFVHRRLVALAMVLGLMLWFIWANNQAVTVAFPFRLGSLSSSLGLVILASALVGACRPAYDIAHHDDAAHASGALLAIHTDPTHLAAVVELLVASGARRISHHRA